MTDYSAVSSSQKSNRLTETAEFFLFILYSYPMQEDSTQRRIHG
jgi:hypothetical protein